jgi:hypothetical protein
MREAVITNINLSNMIKYEETLKQIVPFKQLDDLDSYIIIYGNELRLIVKESSSFISIIMPCQILYNTSDVPQLGVLINYDTLSHILRSYSEETLQTLSFRICVEEETSYFKVIAANDKISLSHLPCSETTLEELSSMMKIPEIEDAAFDIVLFNDGKLDFLKGIANCLPFIDDNAKKNNAFAIYNDKIIVNNKSHVFIYHYNNPVVFMDSETPISLHKKSAKIFNILSNRKIEYNAFITKDERKVYISAEGFYAELNNALSNISPPSQNDLNDLKAPVAVCSLKAKTLLESSIFFNGFYKSNNEHKPLTISIEKEGLKLTLKDSGVAGYNTCNVERLIPYESPVPTVTNFVMTTIPNDSLIRYLKEINPEDSVTIYMDDVESHRAVYFYHPKKEVYIGKMT